MPNLLRNHEAPAQRNIRVAMKRNEEIFESQADRYRYAQERRVESQAELDDLSRANPFGDAGQVDGAIVVGLFLMSMSAVYVLDLCLTSQVSEYLAGMAFGARDGAGASQGFNAVAAKSAKYVVPAAIIGLEMAIAHQIAVKNAEGNEIPGNTLSRLAWIAVGVALCLVVPAMAVATAMMPEVFGELGGMWASKVLVGGLAALAFVAHAAVLFRGEAAYQAKSVMVFGVKSLRLRAVVHLWRRRIDGAARKLRAAVNAFHDLHALHLRQYGAVPHAGPWRRETVATVNEIYGYALLRNPDGATQGAPAARGVEIPGQDAGARGPQDRPPNSAPIEEAGQTATNGDRELIDMLRFRRPEASDEVRP